MSGSIGQQTNWDAGLNEEAQRIVERQLRQDKQKPKEDEEANDRMEEQQRAEKEREKELRDDE